MRSGKKNARGFATHRFGCTRSDIFHSGGIFEINLGGISKLASEHAGWKLARLADSHLAAELAGCPNLTHAHAGKKRKITCAAGGKKLCYAVLFSRRQLFAAQG